MAEDRTTASATVIRDDPGDSQQAFLVVYDHRSDPPRTRVVSLGDGSVTTIGRFASNTVPVDDEEVSRFHALIRRSGIEIVVEDNASRNGTLVNGNLIDGPTRVSSGDEITVGPLTAIVGLTTEVREQILIGSNAELERRLGAECDRALRYQRPLGVGMIRITGGAEAQSAALERIANDVRRMDFLAQYGPDEFAVVLPEADRAATEATLERILHQVRSGDPGGELKVHAGIAGFPEDGVSAPELISRARAALRSARQRGGRGGLSRAPTETPADAIVHDRSLRRVFDLARKVAATPITVLVLGETGAGKEIVAGAIHRMSPRASKPFVALNCSALPEPLLESELFGHERGAFTGAEQRKLGYFEAAQGGTIFLDEVGEMPAGLQAKLLRVLEGRTLTRVGGTQEVPVDVRIICATNRDLELEARRGRFREDLFFRISAFTLVVPPLRDRPDDIVPLAKHFARQFALELGQKPPSLPAETIRVLESYNWPGNVRELRNAMEWAVVLRPEGPIAPQHLPERLHRTPAQESQGGAAMRQRVAEVEKSTVLAALEACGGNQTKAARELGLSRFALIRLMKKYGIKKPSRR